MARQAVTAATGGEEGGGGGGEEGDARASTKRRCQRLIGIHICPCLCWSCTARECCLLILDLVNIYTALDTPAESA